MRILIDLIHPANFHYFKNFIKIMEKNGYEIRVTARNKDVLFDLLKLYNLPYFDMGSGGRGVLGKIFYLIKAEFLMLWNVIFFRPRFVISFSSSFAAHISFLFGITHITFDDTEHNKLNRKIYAPFTKIIFTPDCFMLNFSKNQIRFPGFMELFYLHPNRFKPNYEVLKILKVNPNEKFVIIRFVAWGAIHDIGQSGLDLNCKFELVESLSKFAKVFISSESELPKELLKYKIDIPADKMHDCLYYSSLFVGEGSTMASEAAMLGTPAIYINSLELGYMNQLESKYGLVYNFRTSSGVINKALSIIKRSNLKEFYNNRRIKMLSDTIDPTEMLVWFVLNYPNSYNRVIKNNMSIKDLI